MASGHRWRAKASMPATSGADTDVPLTVCGWLSQVESVEGSAKSSCDYAVTPGGVGRERTVGVNRGHTNDARKPAQVRHIVVTGTISGGGDDDDTLADRIGDRPLQLRTLLRDTLRDGNDLSTVLNGLVDKAGESVEPTAIGAACSVRRRRCRRRLVGVQGRVGCHTGLGGNQDDRHVGAMTFPLGGRLHRASTLVGDISPLERRVARIYRTTNGSDRDTLAGVPLGAYRVQGIVREIIL